MAAWDTPLHIGNYEDLTQNRALIEKLRNDPDGRAKYYREVLRRMPGSAGSFQYGMDGKPVFITHGYENDPETIARRQQQGIQALRFDQPFRDNGMSVRGAIMTNERGFWESPGRIARFHNIIRTAPPGWKAPDWMDTQAIETAYDYYKYRNDGKPWTEWKYLADDDPARGYLNGLATPPGQFLLPSEQQYAQSEGQQTAVEQKKIIDYNDLPWWQQAYLSLFSPENPNPDLRSIENRSWFSKVASPVIPSLMAGLGGFGLGATVGGVWGGAIGALLAGTGTYYQTITGNKVPVINEMLGFFNILSTGTERIIGVSDQAKKYGWDEVMRNIPAAWEAASMTYESGETKVDQINAFAQLVNAGDQVLSFFGADVDAEVDLSNLAKPGEVWRISQGETSPVKLESGLWGAEAQQALKNQLIDAGMTDDLAQYAVQSVVEFIPMLQSLFPEVDITQDPSLVAAAFAQQYGDTGIVNDLTISILLDPMNFMPFLGSKLGESLATKLGNKDLAAAMRASRGSLLVDALPLPLQRLAEAIPGVKSSSGPVAALQLYKANLRGGHILARGWDMPDDMKVKFEELKSGGLKEQDIEVRGDLLVWKDKDGKSQQFKASTKAVPHIPTVEELSPKEKKYAGIDDTWGITELKPGEVAAKGVGAVIKRIFSLTPEAQVFEILNIFHNRVATLMHGANKDVDVMTDMLMQAAGIKPIKPGDPGDQILKSPAMRAVRGAIRAAVGKDGENITNLLSMWQANQGRRGILAKISKALGEEPKTILEQMEKEPEVLLKRVNEVAPAVGTTDEIKAALGVFVGEDALPWNAEQMQATLIISMAKMMDDYLIKTYGIKPDSAAMRFSNMLKGVQSLVLLGLSPAYFLNNAINNVVTRAYTGTAGFMTPRQVDTFLERFGITPNRINEGIGAAGEGDLTGGRLGILQAKDTGDWIDKMTNQTKKLNQTLGIFSRLSADVEKSESRQAITIGIKRFWKRVWKAGTGFSKLDPMVEAALEQKSPGIVRMLYSAAEHGLNIDEIQNAIFNQSNNARIVDVIYSIANETHPEMRGALVDYLDESGILDALKDELANAKTPEDVDNAFAVVDTKLRKFVEQQFANDLIHRAEDVKNKVQVEKVPAIFQIYGDMELMIGQHWVDSRAEWDELYARRESMTPGQFGTEARALFAKQDLEWRGMYEQETITLKAIIEKIGVDNESSRAYVRGLINIHDVWGEYHKQAAKLRQEFFDGIKKNPGETSTQYFDRRNKAWNALQDDLDRMYQTATTQEAKIQMEMDGHFARTYAEATGWDESRAAKWRSDIRDKRYEIVQLQREMRQKTRNMTAGERDHAYVEFNREYNRKIAELKELEANGAIDIAKPVQPTTPSRIKKIKQPETAERAGVQYSAVEDNTPVGVEAALPDDGLPRIWLPTANADTFKPQQGSPVEANGSALTGEAGEAAKITEAKQAIAMVERAKEIIGIANSVERQKHITQGHMQSRMNIENKIRAANPKYTEQQVRDALVLVDLAADSWARQQGWIPDEATRDAYYATHIQDIQIRSADGKMTNLGEDGGNVSLSQHATGKSNSERVEELLSMEPVVVDSSALGTEKAAIIENSKAAYEAIANTNVTIKSNGEVIRFRSRAIRKILNHLGMNLDDIKIIANLREIVKAGVFQFVEPSHKPNEKNVRFYNYSTKIYLDGQVKYVRVIIREENGNLFYDSHVSEGSEIERSWSNPIPAPNSPETITTRPSKDRLAQHILDVKRGISDGNPLRSADGKITNLGEDGLAQSFDPGTKLTEYYHDAPGAITKLLEIKTGDAIGALYHPEVGDIDLIYGWHDKATDNGMGLIHIKEKHGDIITHLQEVISSTSIFQRKHDRLILTSDKYKVIIRLDWNGEDKHWLLTAYEPTDNSTLTRRTSEISGTSQQEDHTAPSLQSGVKINISRGNKDGNPLKQSDLKGQVVFNIEDGRALISIFEGGDISTLVHELGHVFRRDLNPADLNVVAKLGGLKNGAEFLELQERYAVRLDQAAGDPEAVAAIKAEGDYQRWVQAEEYFARAWERYLIDGRVPDVTHVNFTSGEATRLKSIMRRFTDWMLGIYKSLFRKDGVVRGYDQQADFLFRGQQVAVTSELKNIFDRLLDSEGTGERALSFEQLVVKRNQALRGDGRNYRMTQEETQAQAKKDVIKRLLSPYRDARQARKAADDLADFIHTENGMTDEVAIYDALNEIAAHPELDPWKTRVVKTANGSTTTAVAVNIPGKRYTMVYQVIDLGDVHTSDRWVGNQLKPNADYNQAYQPRDRGEQTAREQVESIASKLDPELLMDEYKTTDRGAPIVSADQMVLSGNGRVLSIARAIDGYPERYQDYRTKLDTFARKYGIDPAEYADMQHPILVRELMNATPEETLQFISDANSRASKDMTDFESANADARKIDPKSLVNLVVDEADTVEGMLHKRANQEFVRSFMYKIPETERGELYTNGMLTGKGVTRIKNALFAVVYQGEAPQRLLNMFASSQNENIRIIEAAMMKTLPIMAQLKAEMAAGRFSSDLDITNDVAVAADRVAWYRSEGYQKFKTIDEYLQMDDMFNPLTPLQKEMIRLFGNIKSEKTLREMLRIYVIEALKEPDPRQGTMPGFGEVTSRSKEEIFTTAVAAVDAAEKMKPIQAPLSSEFDGKEAAQPGEKQVAEAFNSGEAVPFDAAMKAGNVLEAEPLPVPQEYTNLRKIVEGDSLFHDRQGRMEAVDWLDFWMGWQALDNLDFLKFDAEFVPKGTPVQAMLESKYPREIAALKEHSRRLNNFVPAREILSSTEPAPGISSPEQSGIPAKGIYVEKAANIFFPDNDAMVGAVYVDGKMVAFIPKNNQGLGDIPDSGIKLLGVDPKRPWRFVYLNRDGEVVSIYTKHPGELLEIPKAASENTRGEGAALEQRAAAGYQVTGQEMNVDSHLWSEDKKVAFAERIMASAEAQKEQYLNDLREIAEVVTRQANELGIDGARVAFGHGDEENAVKKIKSLVAKLSKPDEKIKDGLRWNLEIESTGVIQLILDELAKRGYKVYEMKNRFDQGIPGNYMDVNIKLTRDKDDGVIKELQLINPVMLKAKEGLGGHDAYKIEDELRQIKVPFIDDYGEEAFDLTYDFIVSFSRELYLGAYNFFASGVPENAKANTNLASTFTPNFTEALMRSAYDILNNAFDPTSTQNPKNPAVEGSNVVASNSLSPEAIEVVSKVKSLIRTHLPSTDSIPQNDGGGATLEQRRPGGEDLQPDITTQLQPGEPQMTASEYTDMSNPLGEVPLNGTPSPEPFGQTLTEVYAQVRPLLSRAREAYKQSMLEGQDVKFAELDPASRREIRKWLNKVGNDMTSAKMAAIDHGESLRDAALLNYTRRYGFDNMLGLVAPYQFWFTRSMMNWATRMIDKPGWLAMYARYQQMLDKQDKRMPTRLRGKIRIPMAWLPDWAGKGLFIDPMKQLFPAAQFFQPFEQAQRNESTLSRQATTIIHDMVKSGEVTQEQADAATSDPNDSLWKRAMYIAQEESGMDGGAAGLANMMLSPALWWTIPQNIINGTSERNSVLPITRTGQAIREVGRDTFAEPLTNLVGGALAFPEETIRSKSGLSEFGQWGDYYIDRMLANMAAEDPKLTEQVKIAMIERSGPLYDEAKQRVAFEQALRTPGTAPLMALKYGGSGIQVAVAAISGLFPGGLFPQGELEQRNLAIDYSKAWDDLKQGDDTAIEDFFAEHPEYEARMALYDKPEERLRQFLISTIWDKYTKLERPNRKIAANALGTDFTEMFLNKDTRSYDSLDVQTLAEWSKALGGMVPQTEETTALPEQPGLPLYPPELAGAIETYQNMRDAQFPMWYALQQEYYRMPAGAQRRKFLDQFPMLKDYWTWNREYKAVHEELTPYFEDLQRDQEVEASMDELTSPVLRQLYEYQFTGRLPSPGAQSELRRIWKQYAPSMPFDDFMAMLGELVTK